MRKSIKSLFRIRINQKINNERKSWMENPRTRNNINIKEFKILYFFGNSKLINIYSPYLVKIIDI